MSERKRNSQQAAAGGAAQMQPTGAAASGGSKKKHRPPPLEVADTNISMMPPPTFALPTMRGPMPPGAPMYNQQMVLLPAAQPWEVAEQAELERLLRTICSPRESLLGKSIKIAAHLRHKTVRDVAARLRLMEMEDGKRGPLAGPDDIDQVLDRNDAILSELLKMPAQGRSERDNDRLRGLAKEFLGSAKDARSRLDQKNLKIPVQFVHIPDVAEVLRASS